MKSLHLLLFALLITLFAKAQEGGQEPATPIVPAGEKSPAPGKERRPAFEEMESLSKKVNEGEEEGHLITVSPLVGSSVDTDEKLKYHLFPFVSRTEFVEGRFYMKHDSSIVLRITKTGSAVEERPFSAKELERTRQIIEKLSSAPPKQYKVYVVMRGGYAHSLPLYSEFIFVSLQQYRYNTIATYNVVYGSLGTGSEAGIVAGKVLTSCLSGEIGLHRFRGDPITFSSSGSQTSYREETSLSLNMLKLTPGLKIGFGQKVRYFAGVAASIGIAPEVQEKVVTTFGSGNSSIRLIRDNVQHGGFTAGVLISAGISVRLNRQLALAYNAEVNNQTYSPVKWKTESFRQEGGNGSAYRPRRYSGEFAETAESTEPSVRPKPFYPLNSVSHILSLVLYL
jgi:hypothetical protein